MHAARFWVGCAGLVLWCAASASATTITLSLFSSDPTPAELLDARLDFSVVGNQLDLKVANDTDTNLPPAAFEIVEVGFNATPEVTGLTLTSAPAGWTLLFDQNPGPMHEMDGFGWFDAKLEWGGGSLPTILPGTSETFSFTVTGSGFSQLSFVSALSVAPPGVPMLASAFFIRGPGDDSAFGATNIPEPGSLGLLALGALLVLRRR